MSAKPLLHTHHKHQFIFRGSTCLPMPSQLSPLGPACCPPRAYIKTKVKRLSVPADDARVRRPTMRGSVWVLIRAGLYCRSFGDPGKTPEVAAERTRATGDSAQSPTDHVRLLVRVCRSMVIVKLHECILRI